MSKKKQTKTNIDKKNNIKKSIFFPDVLRGRKLKIVNWLGKAKEPLEYYLETEDPEYLLEAININSVIVSGGHYLEDYWTSGDGKNIKNIDAHDISKRGRYPYLTYMVCLQDAQTTKSSIQRYSSPYNPEREQKRRYIL